MVSLIDFGYGANLRAFNSWNAIEVRYWRNDPRIWRWCRQNSLISNHDQDAWFKRQAQDPSIQMFMIFKDQTPEKEHAGIGACGLTSIDHVNSRAEFSLYIAPDEQRKGFARAALKTLLRHGFDNLNLHLIWGETFDGNPAAKMFEQIGFVKEGTRREFYFKEGKYIDAHLYSVKKEEVQWNG